MKLLPMDGARSLQLNSERGMRTYNQRPDGTMTVPERDARALIREGVAVPASAAGPTAHIRGGYICPCGRRNYFRRCGGCGQEI